MAAPQNIGMPDGTDIGPHYTLQVTALDPTTGATVAGVNVTSMIIETPGTTALSSGDFVANVSQLLVTESQPQA